MPGKERREPVHRQSGRGCDRGPVASSPGGAFGRHPLPRAFYLRPAPAVARSLLGCILVSRLGRVTTAGRIVETEASPGPQAGASARAFRQSSRPLFYGPGGVASGFRAYGLHFCLNAITGPRGTPGCVLLRALEPCRGEAAMVRRRGRHRQTSGLTDGPGKLTKALGITLRENGADLTSSRLAIYPVPGGQHFVVASGPRVGISRARRLPLRFWIRDDPAGPR